MADRYLNPDLTNAKQAAALRAECLLTGDGTLADAAKMLTPDRWRSVAARPALVAEIGARLQEWEERAIAAEERRVEYPPHP